MKTIDISDWHDFQIINIFDIKSPATRSTKTYTEGNTPFVSSKSINNGVDSYLEPKANETLEKGNCISVSPLDGSAFYQENDFLARGGAGSAISLLYNDNLTKYNALFICSIIKKSASKFDYNDALNGKNLAKLSIKLPIQYNKDGSMVLDNKNNPTPNWKYMNDYMKKIEEKAKNKVHLLKEIFDV